MKKKKKAGESIYTYSKASYQPPARWIMVWAVDIYPSQSQGHPQRRGVPLCVGVGRCTHVYLTTTWHPTEMHRNTEELTHRQFNALHTLTHCQGLHPCGFVTWSFPERRITSAKSPTVAKAWPCLPESPAHAGLILLCCLQTFRSFRERPQLGRSVGAKSWLG